MASLKEMWDGAPSYAKAVVLIFVGVQVLAFTIWLRFVRREIQYRKEKKYD